MNKANAIQIKQKAETVILSYLDNTAFNQGLIIIIFLLSIAGYLVASTKNVSGTAFFVVVGFLIIEYILTLSRIHFIREVANFFAALMLISALIISLIVFIFYIIVKL